MTMPTPGDVHVNRPLTNMSVAYLQSLDAFVADKVATINPSDKQGNQWYELLKEFFFRDAMQKRAPGTEAVQVGYGVKLSNYFIDVWAAKKPIADQTRANEDAPLNSDRNTMQLLTRLERIAREKAFAGVALAGASWTTTRTGVAAGPNGVQFLQWNDAAATPLTDVIAWKLVVQLLTGLLPNVLMIGAEVWAKLQTNAQILARVTGGATNSNAASVTKKLVAQLMGLDDLVVMEAVENTAPEKAPGTESYTGAYINGKKGLLFHRNDTVGPEIATAMRTYTWEQYAGSREGIRIKKYRDEPKASDIIEIESTFIHQVVSKDLGVFLDTMVA